MISENSSMVARIRLTLAPAIRVLSVSNGVHALLGFTPGEFLASDITLSDRFHHDDGDVAEVLFSLHNAPSNGTHSVRLRHANGKIRCFKLDYTKTSDATSNQIVLDVLLQDAKSLSKTQCDQTMMENFRAMMENTDDFIFFKDRNHVFTGASQTLVSLTQPVDQWTELLGLTDYDVFPEEYADIYYRLEKQVFEGRPVAHEVQETLTKDGKRGWVDNRKYPIRNAAGEIIGLFGIARDITETKRVASALQREQQFSKLVIEKLPGIFYLYTYPENRLVLWNKQHENLLGYRSEEMAGRHVTDWHLPEARNAVLEAVDDVMKNGQNSIEAPLITKDGRPIYFALTGVRFETEEKSFFMGLGTDITERRKMEEALKVSEERHRLLADNASDVIWTMGLDGRFTYVSPSVERLCGFSNLEVMQQSLTEVLTPASLSLATEQLAKMTEAVEAGTPIPEFRGEFEQRCKGGTTVWTEVNTSAMLNGVGEFVGILGVVRNISKRKRLEDEIRMLAFHDPLTKLSNRRLLNDRLSQAMSSSKRSGCYGALMFLDLDNFKPLNDTYGHEVGDLLLIEVATRLKACVREVDTVARFGGDEFVVMIRELNPDKTQSTVEARAIAEKIRLALCEPYLLSFVNDEQTTTVEHRCSASIGVVLFINHNATQSEVIKWADTAMYLAKESGRNTVYIAAGAPEDQSAKQTAAIPASVAMNTDQNQTTNERR